MIHPPSVNFEQLYGERPDITYGKAGTLFADFTRNYQSAVAGKYKETMVSHVAFAQLLFTPSNLGPAMVGEVWTGGFPMPATISLTHRVSTPSTEYGVTIGPFGENGIDSNLSCRVNEYFTFKNEAVELASGQLDYTVLTVSALENILNRVVDSIS